MNADLGRHLRDLAATGTESAVLAALRGSAMMRAAALQPCPQTGESLLHVAARRGFSQLAADLLVLGLDANRAAFDGLTPLHLAVRHEQPAVIATLLAKGGDPAVVAEDEKGLNAYHMAVAAANARVMHALLQAPDQRGLYHFVPESRGVADVLRAALLARRPDVVHMLLDIGVPLNARGPDNRTALQFLIEASPHNEVSFQLLLDLQAAGADIFCIETAGGETLLMQAARVGWTEAFEYLLSCGLPPDAATRNGDTLLHIAARGPRERILQLALGLGLDIDARNRQGETPLHWAAHRNRYMHVDALAAAGANPLVPDRMGRTPDRVCQSPLQQATHKKVVAAQRQWLLTKQGPVNARRRGFPPSNGR